MPVHYYSPIPAMSAKSFDDAPRYFAASDAVIDAALKVLSGFAETYGDAYSQIAARGRAGSNGPMEFSFKGAPYSPVEAEVLYGLIRSSKPQRIVEIGCGHTTFLIAEAIRAERDAGYAPTYTCVEPYRPSYLAAPPAEVSEFIDKPLQLAPLGLFDELGAGDILFIDSSHVVAYGSDTVFELTQLLPRLAPGVLIHIHDIYLPYEYPERWLRRLKYFWAEQYMLDALLRDTSRYAVRLPLYQLYRERRAELDALFPSLNGASSEPGAYWIEVR